MRQHHAKVHGSRLPNRTCAGCSREFYDEKARRKYCEECDPNAGQNNGNWKDAKKRGTCRTCNTVFSYYPSNKEGVYCSDCVSSSDGLLPENPSKPIERIRTTCPNCEAELKVLRSRLHRQRRGVFCDMDCYGEWLSENVVGPPITSGKGARSTTVRAGGGSAGDLWNVTSMNASTVGRVGTKSDEIPTSITVFPFDNSIVRKRRID